MQHRTQPTQQGQTGHQTQRGQQAQESQQPQHGQWGQQSQMGGYGQHEQWPQQSQQLPGSEWSGGHQQRQVQQQLPQGQPGQQFQQAQSGRGQGLALRDVETGEQRRAVEDIGRAIQVCGWCADQCIQTADPMMIECVRLCEDVQELGEATLALLPRSSRFGQSVLGVFQQAARACAQECGQHQDPHCQECAQTLTQTVQSIQQLLATTGEQPSTAQGQTQAGSSQGRMQQSGFQ